MSEQLKRIKEKLEQLAKLDRNLSLFGAMKHQYKLNPPISIETIRKFERNYEITLPAEYIAFMTTIGNGGAGPFYGLEPFENCLFADLDYKTPDSLLDPGKPFLHTEPWNMEFMPTVDEETNETEYWREFSVFEEKYFAKEQMNGVIAICNCGCAINLNLVVNGKESGNIWTDDRGSDKGIFPSSELGNTDKITFLNWYELWLDSSLNEMKEKKSLDKKPWWNKYLQTIKFMLTKNKLTLTLLLGLFISIAGCSQNKKGELVLTDENHDEYYGKGTELIQPFIILEGQEPRSDKNRDKKLLEGIRYLDAVTKINPNNYSAFWVKGKAYQTLERHENAYQEFEKSFALNKENPDVARELMYECLELGKGPKAVEVALHALKINEKDTGLIANLALSYLINGDLALAKQTIDKAIAIDPKDEINHNLKATIEEVISGKRPQPKKISDLK